MDAPAASSAAAPPAAAAALAAPTTAAANADAAARTVVPRSPAMMPSPRVLLQNRAHLCVQADPKESELRVCTHSNYHSRCQHSQSVPQQASPSISLTGRQHLFHSSWLSQAKARVRTHIPPCPSCSAVVSRVAAAARSPGRWLACCWARAAALQSQGPSSAETRGWAGGRRCSW